MVYIGIIIEINLTKQYVCYLKIILIINIPKKLNVNYLILLLITLYLYVFSKYF